MSTSSPSINGLTSKPTDIVGNVGAKSYVKTMFVVTTHVGPIPKLCIASDEDPRKTIFTCNGGLD